MEVLHIITGLQRGGAETLLCNLCKFDKEYKHSIISMSDIKNKDMVFKDLPNISIYSLNFKNGRIKLSGLFMLYRLIIQIKPDAVQTWMVHADLIGGLIARFAGIKNIFWGVHHTILMGGKSKLSTIFIVKLNAFLSRFIPKKIIYCAEKSRSIQESIGFKKSKGVVIQNGYDINSFFQNRSLGEDFRDEIDISNHIFVIGHVGSYDPLKDQNTLIEALAFLDQEHFDFNAVLVGKNLDNSNLELVTKLKENGLNDRVHLLGVRNDIPAVMNGIDLFVLTSVSEAFPNVLNESMACGTPCVTTNVGDASLIVDNTGWVVQPKDAKAIADAVIKAAGEKESNNINWLQRRGDCTKRISSNFTLEKMIEKYKEVWSIE
ncbi:MAG: glycosyltransferase [Gammaproteobacteria bacterium]